MTLFNELVPVMAKLNGNVNESIDVLLTILKSPTDFMACAFVKWYAHTDLTSDFQEDEKTKHCFKCIQ